MAVTYTFPSDQELIEIEQDKIPLLTQDRAIFDIMPIKTQDSHVLSWEQKDNYFGLQQIRGLNGEPGRVRPVGAKRYTMTPGVYGEFMPIDEVDLTARRPYGANFQGTISIADLVADRQDQLLQRRIDRIEYIGWLLLTTGTFAVAHDNGQVQHTDTFALQTYTAAIDWSTRATATPLADLRAIKLLARGTQARFDSSSTLFLNQVEMNNLLGNTNSADLGGKLTNGLRPVTNSERDINALLLGEDLPQIRVMEEGYFDDTNTFQLWMPDGKATLVGSRRSGAPLGNYLMTRNANNPDLAPGAYTRVIDHGERKIPRLIEVHDGHNGGPALYYPGSIIRMSI